VLAVYACEDQKISPSQRMLERVSHWVGKPMFLGIILLFVTAWILANGLLRRRGLPEFDRPPFFWLQGRGWPGGLADRDRGPDQAEPARQVGGAAGASRPEGGPPERKKVAKLIHRLDELRRDLPSVKNRHDPEAASLQQSMNPDLVLAALDESHALEQRSEPGGTP